MAGPYKNYFGVHNALSRHRGSATAFECVKCGNAAHEWALMDSAETTLTDSHNRVFSPLMEDYSPMCRHCHRVYDKKSITHCPHGHEYAEDNLLIDSGKRKCKKCVYKRNSERSKKRILTPEQHERKLNATRQWRERQRAALGGRLSDDSAPGDMMTPPGT